MPSFDKLGQRPTHKERAQPLERQHLGLLEKRKDYTLRAKDFNKKKATLKNLRQKAADRNEDEFNHKMLSRQGPGSALTSGTKGRNFTGTVKGDRGNRAMSVDDVRKLKMQDVGYVRTLRNAAAKEVRDLEERVAIAQSFAGLDATREDDDEEDEESERPAKRRKPSHVRFYANEEERDEAMNKAPGDEAEGAGDDGQDSEDGTDDKADRVARLRKHLRNAKQRLKVLDEAEADLDLQRVRMAKTATRGAITKKGRKIKRVFERKR